MERSRNEGFRTARDLQGVVEVRDVGPAPSAREKKE